jgi:hypothetical protein
MERGESESDKVIKDECKKWPIPVSGVDVRAPFCWECGFESFRGYEWLLFCVCCVLPGRELSDELITRIEESYTCIMCCVAVCDLESSWKRRPWPTWGCSATGIIYIYVCVCVRYEEHTNGKGMKAILRTKMFYRIFLWYVNQIF